MALRAQYISKVLSPTRSAVLLKELRYCLSTNLFIPPSPPYLVLSAGSATLCRAWESTDCPHACSEWGLRELNPRMRFWRPPHGRCTKAPLWEPCRTEGGVKNGHCPRDGRTRLPARRSYPRPILGMRSRYLTEPSPADTTHGKDGSEKVVQYARAIRVSRSNV